MGVRLCSPGSSPWLGPASHWCPSLVPTCPELDSPSQGDTRTNLPWLRPDGLWRLVGSVPSVSIHPRVQLQVTQGEGQPPTLPQDSCTPAEPPLGQLGHTHLGIPAAPLGLSVLLGTVLQIQRGWLGWSVGQGFGVS